MTQDNEDDGRQAEISMFAKLASGDTFQGTSEKDTSSMDSKKMFAAAAQKVEGGDGGGTFCVASSPNAHMAVASSNLDAAVAALTTGQDGALQALETTPIPEELDMRQFATKPPPEPTPMYNEKVLLPRPLFFGPVLPPRVIHEARQAVENAMMEQNLDFSKRPRLSQLPPHVRNVVGAIEAFGYGIPIFPCDVTDKDSFRGNEYVSTFQPVWGDVARSERERLIEIYRDSQPAEPEDEATREETMILSASGQSTPVAASSSEVTSENDQSPPGIAFNNSFPELQSKSELAKSRLLRSKSAPVVPAGKKAPALPISENDQFLQWAREKPNSPARNKANESLKKSTPINEKELYEKELFSKWAQGGGPSTSPELEIKKSRSATAPDEKDIFSKWAQGPVDQSPVVSQTRNVNTNASDVELFSKWAQEGGDESPAISNRKSDEESTDDHVKSSEATGTSTSAITDKNQFAKWAQGASSPANSPAPPVESKKAEVSDPAQAQKDLFSKWAGGESSDDKKAEEHDSAQAEKDMFSKWAGGESSDDKKAEEQDSAQAEKDMFSKWAGGESSDDKKAEEHDSAQAEKDMFSKWANGGDHETNEVLSENDNNAQESSPESIGEKSDAVSEQDTFSQWARAGQDAASSSATKAPVQRPFDTFQAVPDVAVDDYSDDDSVERSEVKKKVGMNENLNSALASLANEDGGRSMPTGTESIGADEASALLAQIGATTEGGRPLSNFEITNGLVPLFGCDDTTLPAESDLGIFQTKEEQTRSMEQRRSQEIIDKHTYPNIYGQVACPNPAQGPDDSHSWNSRSPPARKHMMPHGATGHLTSGPGIVPVLDSSPAKPKNKYDAGKQSPASVEGSVTGGVRGERSRSADSQSAYSVSSRSGDGTGRSHSKRRHQKSQSRNAQSFDAKSRFGWWNVSDTNSPADEAIAEDEPRLLQLPHNETGSASTQVATGLTPTREFLRQENMPLSELHSATSIAEALPFLSDRPPSFRYLQIDTEAVGFPALGGEIEPLFCSLAIYHVESTTSSHDPRAAPVPNFERCGRVTEVLTFDVVRDSDVESACFESLWPYATSEDQTKSAHDEAAQGSRCGVFPLASNLNVSNLYAILIVHKVLSEKYDAEIYIKPPKIDGKGAASPSIDVQKYREKAARASSRQGEFLMPFAFGVAPLLQIFGTDIPTSVNSRAVQIPLFKFTNGFGDRPIISHIMVMLYPRADHRTSGIAGPAPLSNSGTAMLVMRNFGYLGLHQAVFSKSSLRARDRLVDFSGEIQVRREVSKSSESDSSPRIVDDRTYVVAPWRTEYVSEPTVNGGRNCISSTSDDISDEAPGESRERVDKSSSRFYAKEMAPVPLKLMPSSGKPAAASSRGRSGRNSRSALRELDVEPSFHTTFCNELLCHPRLLHKSPKGNIVIKVELREIEWSELHQTYLAHVPKFGPSLHNPRRGPFLVQGAFTACGYQVVNAHFLDEFKVKLPLLLESQSAGGGLQSGPLALFFTVYKIDIKPKRGWSTPLKGTDAGSELKKSRRRMIACGFLPITTSDTSCLIDNGLHDVKLVYTSEKSENDEEGRDTLILSHLSEHKSREGTYVLGRTPVESGDEDEKPLHDLDGSFFGSESAPSETATESDMARSDTSSGTGLSRSGAKRDPMGLQVRIVVHSSIHPQNATLNEFLSQIPDISTPVPLALTVPSSAWKLSRPELLKHIATAETEPELSISSDEMQKLLLYTIDLSKPSLCSAAESSSHFLRIFSQLMRTLVSGNGSPSLLWANPASVIPLRVHAFATLLQIVNSMNTYMVRNGCTQLDGRGRWNLTQLSRVIAMVFDESDLFAASNEGAGEALDLDEWKAMYTNTTSSGSPKESMNEEAPKRKRRHRREQSLPKPPMARSKTSGPADNRESFEDLKAALALTSDIITNSDMDTEALDSLDAPPESSELPPGKEKTAISSNFKIDSKSEFQSNLWAGSAESPTQSSSASGSIMAKNMIQAYGGASGPGNRRKWMTAPMSTIPEEDAGPGFTESSTDLGALVTPLSPDIPSDKKTDAGAESDAVDDELVIRKSVASTAERKKMRVPNVGKPTKEHPKRPSYGSLDSSHTSLSSLTVPTSEEALTAGTAFLDEIGKNLGISTPLGKGMGGEELRVGHAHHRKTRSRCSIDWTIPDVSGLMGNRDSFEKPPSGEIDPPRTLDAAGDRSIEEDFGAEETTMVSLSEEEKNTVLLPGYLDRLVTLGRVDGRGRWCPYAYEVVIMQWVALLVDQRRSAEKPKEDGTFSDPTESPVPSDYPRGSFSEASEGLSEAAMRARGVAIACTPVLLEIIKKSIGWRVHYLHEQAKKKDSSYSRHCTPLVRLDEVLFGHLEQLVSIITDACLDSRNFDSWEFRQTCIDVNDSLIRFLRDMFAFLQTSQASRLILVYFSRFVIRDGKLRQDRDSKIGLRCSWEISKLRLNAVTTLVRFPDFIRVNSPQFHNWSSWSMQAPPHLALDFFTTALKHLKSLALPEISSTDRQEDSPMLTFPELKPHWLAEFVTDICLSGTEHAEQYIQQRAGSLLNELFWSQSQEAKANGTSSAVATMYVPFLRKILGYLPYLASMSAKHQLRKDLLPCATYVLQCAPDGITRALWRELCIEAEGKGKSEKYGGVMDLDGAAFRGDSRGNDPVIQVSSVEEQRLDPDILDMFGLLNLALSTFEYEGKDEGLEVDDIVDSNDQLAVWNKEFLLAVSDSRDRKTSLLGQGRMMQGRRREKKDTNKEKSFSTTNSRKWYSHDASLAIIHTSRVIVREMVGMQRSRVETQSDGRIGTNDAGAEKQNHHLNFSSVDTIIFVRAATSVYLHSLSLRQSDIAIVKTLDAAVEIVKIFGIKVFLRAVGETLQHWMRLVSFLCGARRAEVRVQALEFLWLVLRLTWDSYGSFYRIRLPLLSVQTEVMERIVATATARNYREQRRMGSPMQSLPNDCAEATLSPLWRTLDRLHHQSASQNLAFRSALIRLAESMKKLYRAYIAAHALAIVNRARSPLSPANSAFDEGDSQDEASVYLQSRRIIVHRIINASAGYSKQFLGLQRSYSQLATVAHNEAVEDAFLDAAYVFSPTELPTNRVAWLRKLAEFHASRKKYAEEATCHIHIHLTLRQAARLHHSLWANIPFVAWTVPADGLHLEGDGPAGEPEDYYDADFDLEELTVEDPAIFENGLGKHIDKRNSFRRQFYRVANSLRMNTGDPEIGGNKNLFYGVTFPFEYRSTMSGISLRELEEELVDEAEMAGTLFLSAGIPESSRYAWSLATQIYAEKFNYGKLAHAYRQLANVVSSNVPVIDTNSHALELSHPLGRFYRVWFHGGAPDEINGTEFVYRAAGSVKLDAFGDQLSDVIKGILPENTPIDLVLDDGRPERFGFKPTTKRRPLGPTPIEPVKIKVTPLRPLLKRANMIRGTPEWFFGYIDVAFAAEPTSSSFLSKSSRKSRGHMDFPQRDVLPSHHSRNSSASVFASSGSMCSVTTSRAPERNVATASISRGGASREKSSAGEQGALVGVDKFSFLQPARKDRGGRSARDAWLRNPCDIADKSLRVTQLQVEQAFPACNARQTVMHRTVFQQSPLEAGIDAVCSWCSVLFRTAVASNGMAVLGAQEEFGIGSGAAKVVAESMYSGKVKEMGLVLLQKDAYIAESNDGGFSMYDRLTEAEVNMLQIKLGRAIVVFMEILHLLIARNRDLLLEVMEARKRGEVPSVYQNRAQSVAGRSTPDDNSRRRGHARGVSSTSGFSTGYTSAGEIESYMRHPDDASASNFSSLAANDKTDKNIAVQSELQRTFIGMAKALYNPLTIILGDETPRWLKEICKDNYFSSSMYRRTEGEIRMADEIYFYAADNMISDASGQGENYSPPFHVMSIDSDRNSTGYESGNGSQGGGSIGRSMGTTARARRGMWKQASAAGTTISALSGEGSSIFHV